MTWQRSYPVRFGEIDHAGVMYYPALFDRIHRAFEDFWGDITGRSYASVLDDDGVGFPLVDVHASFRRPFRFGEQLAVRLDVERIGTKSVTFVAQLLQGDEAEPRATARLVTGVVSMRTFRPTALPDLHRGLLEPHLREGERG